MKDFIRKKVIEGMDNLSNPKGERFKFDIPVPEDIKKIKDVFVSNGHKLFVVGGAVRDALLNKDIKDYDLATDATPDKVEEMMKGAGLRTIPTGKAFGVINVFVDNEEFEVATFRKDLGSGRRPDGVEFTTIDQDVKRRDLTINALFFDIDTSEVVDLVGGVEDLKKGIVKTVGNPEDRFGEDRLRILRAIRFAARFGSELEPSVDAALMRDSSLDGVSPERIRDEFLKGLKTAKSVSHFLRLLDRFELIEVIFRGLNVAVEFREERDPTVALATMLRGNEPSVLAKRLNKLTFSANESKAISFLVSLITFNDPSQVFSLKKKHMGSGVSDEQLRAFTKLAGLDNSIIEAFIKFNLSVTGDDVAKLGVKPGPEMGQKIKQMEIDNFKKLIAN